MSLKLSSRHHYILIITILAISAFTHLWNAAGFPDIFFDEAAYMHRTMHVLKGLGPEEGALYDHPFFGQIFLAGVLGAIGYPQSLHTLSDPSSISLLYLVPRIIMGILAVADTFLIYKIADKRYGKNAALISAVLFSVMPISWIFRRILLDSILLPFLLLSILAALYSRESKHNTLLVLLSGACLGLAIFTKIPAFTIMPLVGSLVFFYNRKRLKMLGLWLIPVIMIPLAWPVQSIESGHLSNWIYDVFYYQTHRTGGSDLYAISKTFVQMDPVLFWLAAAALVFAAIRRDHFIITWFVPFVVFLYLIGYNQYFYWIPVIPVMCIAAGVLIVKLSEKIPRKQIAKVCMVIVISGISVFGMANLVDIITTDMSSAQYAAISYVANDTKYTHNALVLAGPAYSWILDDVFHKKNVWVYYYALSAPLYPKTVFVSDPHFHFDLNLGKGLVNLYNSTHVVSAFDGSISRYDTSHYPYQNLYYTTEGNHIEIRVR
ncbi:MAG: glycosyltransferase family 39 protein [Candidatus Nitrosotalea sp.]|nr:glycosyltransferase family 39 protein [Candidatus Nitrosotalea sp.]